MEQLEILRHFRDTGALEMGHFELRSGLHSDQFFQCAKVLRFPAIAEALCQALVDALCDEVGEDLRAESVIAPAIGGIVVGQEVARVLNVQSLFAEKHDGGLVLRRGFSICPGERFVVAEDVVTRGGRVQQTIDLVNEHGGEVVAVGVLVDRSGGAAKFDCPMVSLLALEPVTWEPEQCPLCAKGGKAAHPGS